MDNYALRTFGLTKRFYNKVAVNNVSLNIRQGDIYGFIGPNGAGKTTAMKVILNLLNPDAGSIELFGAMDNRLALHHVGSLIEAPGLYTNCTAYENMKRFAILKHSPDNEIAYYLRMVGLEAASQKRVGTFSLGMKQRLGIAIALLGNPQMLILDEPVNGLDPMGIKDVRDIIQFINKERGVTFLISSHLLGELEKIATAYGIINCGCLIEEITAQALNERCGYSVRIRCDEIERAAALLRAEFGIENPTVNNGFIELPCDPTVSSRINACLVKADIAVHELALLRCSCEDYLLSKLQTLNVGSGVGQYV